MRGNEKQLETQGQRLDRWLWATRWFKTRSIAVDAINNGRVELNAARAKPAKMVRPGDQIIIRKPPYRYEVTVIGVVENRVSAKLAAALYRESDASIAARAQLGEKLRLGQVREDRRAGKLNKKDRREREQLKRHFE